MTIAIVTIAAFMVGYWFGYNSGFEDGFEDSHWGPIEDQHR